MMQFAEGNAVFYDRLAVRFAVGDNVGGFQKFQVPKAAKRTLLSIGPKDPLPESALVQSISHGRGYIGPAGLGPCIRNGRCLSPDVPPRIHKGHIIYRDLERQIRRIIANNKDGPYGKISARDNTVKIYEWHFPEHGHSKPRIVPMLRIGSPVTIKKQLIRTEAVIVRPFRGGCD